MFVDKCVHTSCWGVAWLNAIGQWRSRQPFCDPLYSQAQYILNLTSWCNNCAVTDLLHCCTQGANVGHGGEVDDIVHRAGLRGSWVEDQHCSKLISDEDISSRADVDVHVSSWNRVSRVISQQCSSLLSTALWIFVVQSDIFAISTADCLGGDVLANTVGVGLSELEPTCTLDVVLDVSIHLRNDKLRVIPAYQDRYVCSTSKTTTSS